jgi:predicted nucleic acid-binding protein
MSADRQFVDTNVLVYAHDVTAGVKHQRARGLVEELWQSRQGCLSIQVLQEFLVITTRKIPQPLEASVAAQVVADLAHWHVHAPVPSDVRAAIDIHTRTGLSFWDSMILHSAKELGCQLVHSEDLNPGQDYSGVHVRNPFSEGPE